jgi:hypothetical protein
MVMHSPSHSALSDIMNPAVGACPIANPMKKKIEKAKNNLFMLSGFYKTIFTKVIKKVSRIAKNINSDLAMFV